MTIGSVTERTNKLRPLTQPRVCASRVPGRGESVSPEGLRASLVHWPKPERLSLPTAVRILQVLESRKPNQTDRGEYCFCLKSERGLNALL